MIESLVLLMIAAPATFCLINIGLHLQQEILIEEVMEETLLCHFKKKSTCLQDLRRQLEPFSEDPVIAYFDQHKNKVQLFLKMQTRSKTSVILKSEMSLDLSTP